MDSFTVIWLVLALLAGPEAISHAEAANTAAPSDSQVTSAITQKLFLDPYFSPDQIKVKTELGVVTLTGLVNDMRSKDRAVREVEAIRGVRSVVDRLNVRPLRSPDPQIRRDVIQALKTDPTTSAYAMNVSVQNGVVDLTGKVKSFTEKDLAGWVAEGVPGVTDLKNNLIVQYDSARSDRAITDDIQGRLRADPRVAGYRVNVSVNRGIASLSGDVGSAAAKRQAFFDAWVLGVKDVEFSGLKVDPNIAGAQMARASNLPPQDAIIRDSVRGSILWDPRVNYFNVATSVNQGVVTLTGAVDSLIAKQSAEDDARNTVGVISVVNQLQVQPEHRSDAAIAEDVDNSLRWNLPAADSRKITAEVRGGVVTLTGTAVSPYEKWQARDAATRVRGVVVVNNQVQVASGKSAFSDSGIRDAIQQAMRWDPKLTLDANHVQVAVKDGTARLTGTVDDASERWAAARDAFDAGATQVENELGVSGNSTASVIR